MHHVIPSAKLLKNATHKLSCRSRWLIEKQ